MNMFRLVDQVLAYGVDGDLVELGCNSVKSSVLISKIMRHYNYEKKLYVYDSFEGLPPLNAVDGSAYHQGNSKQLKMYYIIISRNTTNPYQKYIVAGSTRLCLTNCLRKLLLHISTADLYDSILISLEYVYPRLTKGAICLVDDYGDPSINPAGCNKLPGSRRHVTNIW